MSSPDPKLSIVTAIHNACAINEIFWESLSAHTSVPFELILIDNHSTDGSGEYFAALAASRLPEGQSIVYLQNAKNQSYPRSQNQGMAVARADILVFMNNDVWMPHGWHLPFEKALTENPLLILSPSGQEAQPTQSASDELKSNWRKIETQSKLWKMIFRRSEKERLQWALRRMYGDLENFVSPTLSQDKKYFNGIKGDTVIFHRKLRDVMPEIWDEQFQAADWHLYLSAAKRHESNKDFPLPRVLLDSYVHHFGRYSIKKSNVEDFWTDARFVSIEDHWGRDTIQRLWWGYHLPA